MYGLLFNRKGFTTIELLVVLVIIAVLVGGGISAYNAYIGKTKLAKAKTDLIMIQQAVEGFYSVNNYYIESDDSSALATLGPSAEIIGTSDSNPSRKYTYKRLSQTSYKIYSSKEIDGTYFAIATGDNGIPGNVEFLTSISTS